MSLFPTVSYQKDLMLSLQFKCIVFFNTLIFVSSTYRVYFIIFFLKSAVFTIKKEPSPSPEKNGLLFIILETDD